MKETARPSWCLQPVNASLSARAALLEAIAGSVTQVADQSAAARAFTELAAQPNTAPLPVPSPRLPHSPAAAPRSGSRSTQQPAPSSLCPLAAAQPRRRAGATPW